MTTIKDISELTGFSPSTISRVLNLDASINVSTKTRKKIFEAAEALSYTKHMKSNKTKKATYNVGLIHWYNEFQELNDPYFISIRMGIETDCKSNSINLIKIYNDSMWESTLASNSYDGLIILGKFSKNRINCFKQYANHIVFVHSNNPKFEYDSVQADFRELTNDVLKHLSSQGHKRIGFIGGREIISGSDEKIIDSREIQFKNYMKRLGLYRSDYVRIGNYDFEDGYTLMKDLIKTNNKDLPTAMFIGSDSLAIGAIRAINEIGLSIPSDISIIGCNDIPTSQYTSPSLSTVKIYTEFMGQIAIKLLLEQINETREHHIQVIIPHKLVIRESSEKTRKTKSG